ncbi:nuclear transport factor 2 family protein [Azospirillum sp. SYSU D00513]|uniref:nuclear transport factor 2 family protein n=1 Tax=Azospirillum sp. SYSU D00513 TaxID=2812561 RepID=UPI001A957524|nr:nuclear transport factor 2 family protein [Azospirillum sp. SYSU D00513]
MKTLLKTALPALLLGALAGPALAGPAADLAARRIEAIARGDVAAITGAYAEGATLQWVGGPLDGAYSGPALAEVWGKFAKAQGPLKAAVTSVAESANPKGATVSSDVVFTGKSQIKVRYIQLYREGKLTGEIWQVDPNLPG